MDESNERLDEALGLNTSIARRDFLNGALVSAGALWAAHLSPMQQLVRGQQPAATAPKSSWGGNTQEAFDAGSVTDCLLSCNAHFMASSCRWIVFGVLRPMEAKSS